jgi:hypothetical protein
VTFDVVLLVLRLVLAVVLYAFLIAGLWIVRRDLVAAAQAVAGRRRRYGQLVVVASADGAVTPGTSYPLLPITSLGRSPTNTITLADDYASAEHALLMYRGGQWWLQDQGSRNGTSLNGARIGQPVVVSAGDLVGVGQVQFKIELE